MAERQKWILENVYHLRSTSNGVVRTDWNNSQTHLTQSLTPALGRRSHGDHPKFPNGKSMAYRRWETGWKYTAQKWQVCLMPKHKCWCSAFWPSQELMINQQGKFLAVLWHHFASFPSWFYAVNHCWFFVDFFFLPVRVKHREDSSLLKHVFSFLRVKFDNEISCFYLVPISNFL